MFIRISSVNLMPSSNKIITFSQTYQQNGPLLLIQKQSKYVFTQPVIQKSKLARKCGKILNRTGSVYIQARRACLFTEPIPLSALQSRQYLFSCSATMSLVIKKHHCKLLHYGFEQYQFRPSQSDSKTHNMLSFVILYQQQENCHCQETLRLPYPTRQKKVGC